jgi:hypothetical protein
MLAEGAGLGTTFAIGRALSPALESRPGAAAAILVALSAILLGIVLEGVLVGAAQEHVLRRQLPGLRPRSWVLATAAGAGLAWALGMIPSTVVALTSSAQESAPMPEPAPLVQYGLAIALGLVTGPLLGAAQWTVLRRVLPRAGWWLGANALAWAAGMLVIFAGMDRVPWGGRPLAVLSSIFVVCAFAGLVVGAIHGRVLERLLRPPAGRSRSDQGVPAR